MNKRKAEESGETKKISDFFKSSTPKKAKKEEESKEEKKTVEVGGKEEDVEEVAEAIEEVRTGLAAHLTDPKWYSLLKNEFKKPYFVKIENHLASEKEKDQQVFPPENEIFAALNLTPFDNVKCVILGQDPYHDDGQGHGVCFSVKKGVAIPPSLRNIYKELETDIEGFKAPNHGYLEKWAREGILLLNATLTVQAHKANSHAKIGWQIFTDMVISLINKHKKNVVFILWGGFAQKKAANIDKSKHCVIEAAHPSPLSVTKFRGCKVFSKTNAYLKSKGIPEIDWKLPKTI
eukprot:TRINITY_DN1909_c0_g1_i1.p1 TRINITY_DN1909_c0_g1~~TRINITY_DN1909_c0_g1_i1.p1  ORF type:complete len:305 (+),score=81.29 TRINITY_DN1909_c0_g1_i1:43-915(+)